MTEPLEDNPWATPLPQPRKARVPTIFLSVAVMCGVVALPLSVLGLRADQKINAEREAERIEADLEACERGNVNRELQLRLHRSQRNYVDDTVNGIAAYAQLTAAERAVLDQHLAPAREEIQAAIDLIKTTDCQAVVPGAQEDP